MLPIKSTVPVRVATWSLIAINCVVFLFETSLSEAQLEEFLSQFALVPAHFSDRLE
jgi:rhomboid family protein